MKNLINFLIKYSVVFLFIFLEITALVLISGNKGYQRSVLLSSANRAAGGMYDKSSHFEFFKLKDANADLAIENTELKNRVTLLENQLASLTDSTYIAGWSKKGIPPEKEYEYIPARVVRNTTHFAQNYLTLNKGSEHGIKPDMGVVSDAGVVGIVQAVSSKFSRVISILNPQTIISTKFKKNNYYGPLMWDGRDYRYASLGDIARHVKFSLGDTLITSGLVKTFPEGIMVGTIDDFDIKESDAYYNIRVKLGVDFRTLTYVKVIKYQNYEEQEDLEQSIYGGAGQNKKKGKVE